MAVSAIMSLLSLPGTLFLLVALYVAWTVRAWYRLRSVPGPWFNALSFTGLSTTVYRGNFHVEVQALAGRYGDLLRIAPNEVITSDVDVARRIASPKSGYTRGPWYGTFRFYPDFDCSFSIRDEARHQVIRAGISQGYSNPITGFETCVSAQIERLVGLIDRKYLSSDAEYRPVEFASLAHFFSMDVIGDITFGKPFGFLDEGVDIFGYLAWNEQFFKTMMTMATVPGITKVLYKPPMKWMAPRDTDKVGLGRFIAAAKTVVQERLAAAAEGEKQKDMMGYLIAQGLETEELVSEAVLQVVAGTDSVATATRMTLLHVISNPPVCRKLQHEIDTAIASGAISSPIKDSEARRLPYLQAVIREGIRIFPGATPPLFKTVPEGGDVIEGHTLPAGTQVGVNIFGIMRDKRIWGADADLFRPERWTEADEKRLERMGTVLEVHFGFGRFKCLGRPIVFLELNKIIPELLRRYDLAIINASSPLKIINAGFYLMTDMWMRITKREHSL